MITGMFIYPIGDKARILDVGCGEGGFSDFLLPEQKANYVGIDISEEAIKLAKQKRGTTNKQQFIHTTAQAYKPETTLFDVIIFSEAIYYVNHMEIMSQYSKYLSPDGVIVISIWFTDKIQYIKTGIFEDIRKEYDMVESFDISGTTSKSKREKKVPMSFHIEAFRVRNAAGGS